MADRSNSSYYLGGVNTGFWDAREELEDGYKQIPSAGATRVQAAMCELTHLLDQIQEAGNWKQLQSIVNPVLGQFCFNYGIAVGMAESIGDNVKGLFDPLKMLVLAGLHEELNSVRSHRGHGTILNIGSDLVSPAKALSIAILAEAPPTWLKDLKEADAQLRTIIHEVDLLIEHPIVSVENYARQKWGARWDSWQESEGWWVQSRALYSSRDPNKMHEGGVLAGRLFGNLVLTVLAIWGAYSVAVRGAELAAAGGRVVLGTLSLAAAQADALAAQTALDELKAERAAAEEAKDTGKAARIARDERWAADRLKAAQAQTTLAEWKLRAPNLLKSIEKAEL